MNGRNTRKKTTLHSISTGRFINMIITLLWLQKKKIPTRSDWELSFVLFLICQSMDRLFGGNSISCNVFFPPFALIVENRLVCHQCGRTITHIDLQLFFSSNLLGRWLIHLNGLIMIYVSWQLLFFSLGSANSHWCDGVKCAPINRCTECFFYNF